MNLWKRHKLPEGNTYSKEIDENRGLSLLIEDNPLSSHFNPKCGDRPSDLKNFLRALQVRQYGCSIELSDRVLIRNINLLLKEYDSLLVARGIKFASLTSDFPYSTKYIKVCIEKVKERMNEK